ncbi:MAG: TlyA family RNA methyltransferase [Dongiaceae bacterium]
MAGGKKRLDLVLVERGLAPSRTIAQGLILAGKVLSETKRLDKPGQLVDDAIALTVKEKEHPWVSRGGVKLNYALDHFRIDVKDAVGLDIGASTGGFTDVLLSRGAAKVYAIDVGHNQLDWKLRQDPRVIAQEGVNARYLTEENVPEAVDIIVCDVSFISLTLALPAALKFAKKGAWLAALIKPQFEVGKENVGKGGIVRDPSLHQEVCRKIENWLTSLQDWRIEGIIDSPITGTDGNKEFLLTARKI